MGKVSPCSHDRQSPHTKPRAQSAENNTVIISLKLEHRTPSKYLYKIRQM